MQLVDHDPVVALQAVVRHAVTELGIEGAALDGVAGIGARVGGEASHVDAAESEVQIQARRRLQWVGRTAQGNRGVTVNRAAQVYLPCLCGVAAEVGDGAIKAADNSPELDWQ